jgi:hypothetical protein
MIGSKDFGVDWTQRKDLPNLLTDDVKFDLQLLPKIEELEDEEDNLDDEEKKNKIKEAKELAKEAKKNKKLEKAKEAGGEEITQGDDVFPEDVGDDKDQ